MALESEVKVEIYCPVHPPPAISDTLEPPAPKTLPPVIYHVQCNAMPDTSEPELLSRFLGRHTELPDGLLRELIAFGAVYARVGTVDEHTSPRPPRIRTDFVLPSGEPLYARIHANPKRHTADRPPRVLHEDAAGLVAVDKPSGLPVAPSNDNAVECVASLVNASVTHRLDAGTCGIVLLVRGAGAAGAVNAALGSARKTYRVLSDARPPAGTLVHWYNRAAKRGRGALASRLLAPCDDRDRPPKEEGNWAIAELVVLGVRPVETGGSRRFETTVRLVTGRTHQIRMQFAACGAAVVGDSKYRPVDGVAAGWAEGLELGADAHRLGLCASRLEIVWRGEKIAFEAGPAWWDRESDVRGCLEPDDVPK